MEEEGTIIMAALSTFTPPQLSQLTNSILSLIHQNHRRLFSILCSPSLFFLTVHHLHSVSLPHKTLLIARHLLTSLHLLTRHFHPPPPPPPSQYISATMKQRELDSVLLLLLLCDIHRHDPEVLKAPPLKWREALMKQYCRPMLSLSGIGVHNGCLLMPFIEMVIRCWRFVSVMGGCCRGTEGKEVAAAAAAVVALPSVEVKGRGKEYCVICREEMKQGRDVCELPCQHLFHWICILPWLRKRNTCPCCRFRLPTDDAFGEIERLWEVLVKVGSGAISGGVYVIA